LAFAYFLFESNRKNLGVDGGILWGRVEDSKGGAADCEERSDGTEGPPTDEGGREELRLWRRSEQGARRPDKRTTGDESGRREEDNLLKGEARYIGRRERPNPVYLNCMCASGRASIINSKLWRKFIWRLVQICLSPIFFTRFSRLRWLVSLQFRPSLNG